MNFFQRQDQARKNTFLLVILYALTVLCIIAAVYFAAIVVVSTAQTSHSSQQYYVEDSLPPVVWWNQDIFISVAGAVSLIILFGTLFKTSQLSQGGKAVAELLAGRLISPDTRNPNERRVLNVVEEMAIAAGTSVPPVYLLAKELSINAFAAGFTTKDAVIGVTQGAVDLLNREELQGVIAHEFSHILNGDMRLNIRLVGIIFGIMMLAHLGELIFRSMRGSSRSRGKDNGRLTIVLFTSGLLLYVIGWIGIFFARIIQSAVSRERESLADASGVQFTRYPGGLAGALKKIGALSLGSKISNVNAEQASHFYFAEGIKLFISLFATHPPLVERIKALDPSFDGKFPPLEYPRIRENVRAYEEKIESGTKAKAQKQEDFKKAIAASLAAAPVQITARAGKITEANLSYAASLIDGLPAVLKESARNPISAEAVIFALLLDKNPAIRKQQELYLFGNADYRTKRPLSLLMPYIIQLETRFRFPLIKLCLPSLATLSERQYASFQENVRKLILTDQAQQPFELALESVVFHHLDSYFGRKSQTARPSPGGLAASEIVLLSFFSQVSSSDAGDAKAAFKEAVKLLGLPVTEPITGKLEPERIKIAVEDLKTISFQERGKFLEACAASVRHDGKITAEEMEMVRAIADVLDCPLPPLGK